MDPVIALREQLPARVAGLSPAVYLVAAAATILGVAHHVDHLVRGNHVGWPVAPEVNAFTYSLAIYPLIAISLYLSATGRVAVRYWAGFFAFGTGMLVFLHLSPWAVEPPGDVIGPYGNPLVGYLAFAVLVCLIGSLVVGSVYTGVLAVRRTD